MRDRPLLVDTNTVLECHRVNIWRALAGSCQLEMVSKCVEETQSGFQNRRVEELIDPKALVASLAAVHQVDDAEIAAVALMGGSGLHDGEKHLWAFALSRGRDHLVCGPDSGSLKFGCEAGRRNSLVALAEVLELCGMKPAVQLKFHFGRVWHQQKMTEFALEAIKAAPSAQVQEG